MKSVKERKINEATKPNWPLNLLWKDFGFRKPYCGLTPFKFSLPPEVLQLQKMYAHPRFATTNNKGKLPAIQL